MSLAVLAVDDSRTMRDLIRAALTPAGFAVRTAEDGAAALDHLTDPRPDVVLTDLNMPRLDGFGLIAELRRREALRGLPILVLTTESAPALKDRARRAGATGWIVKPFEPGQLVAALRRVAC